MYKITKTEVKEIVNRLDRESVFALPPEELCVYTYYRIDNLLSQYNVIHRDEIKYRFCETGPGRRRFDPLALDIVLNSKWFADNVYGKHFFTRENWFFRTEADYHSRTKVIKEYVIKRMCDEFKDKAVLVGIHKIIQKLIKGTGFRQTGYETNADKGFLEVMFSATIDKKQSFLLRFYNDLEWISPDSWQIWDLLKKSYKQKCVPVIIAPRIHGSCFSLFKLLGIFARNIYYFVARKSIHDISKTIVKKEDSFEEANIFLGKIFDISGKGLATPFAAVEQLFNLTIPDHIDDFSKNLENNKDIITECLKNEFKFLVNAGADMSVVQRTKRIESILDIGLGGLGVISGTVKRNKKLIHELGCS